MALLAVEALLLAALIVATFESLLWWRKMAAEVHEELTTYLVLSAAVRFGAALVVAAGIATSHVAPGRLWHWGLPYRLGGVLLIAGIEGAQRWLRRRFTP